MKDVNLRDKILAAALELMQQHGVKKFTQPQVAKLAGIRQSHLTYYFPTKADLIKGLLEGHLKSASDGKGASGTASVDMREAFGVLTSNKGRMRFFLGLIAEAQSDPELRRMVNMHMAAFDARVAVYFGRLPEDPDVDVFLNVLRGCGMRQLVRETAVEIDVDAIAARLGLLPSSGGLD